MCYKCHSKENLQSQIIRTDICIYGATSSGITIAWLGCFFSGYAVNWMIDCY
jgi:hypothetical protein